MATTRWRSSLSNIETRLRRSLGLAGPIDLELPAPPQLTPVVIADDATRPGTASQLRGRRWRCSKTISIVGGNTGSIWLYAEQPFPAESNLTKAHEGGVIVDHISVSINGAAAGVPYQLVLAIFATNLVLAPGIPIAVTTKDVWMVDPMRFDGEPAPLSSGASAAQTAYAARPVWEVQAVANPLTQFLQLPCGDIFVNWNSCLVIGNGVPSAANVVLYANFGGRVF